MLKQKLEINNQFLSSPAFEAAIIKLQDWKEKVLKVAEQRELRAILLKIPDNLVPKHNSELIIEPASK